MDSAGPSSDGSGIPAVEPDMRPPVPRLGWSGGFGGADEGRGEGVLERVDGVGGGAAGREVFGGQLVGEFGQVVGGVAASDRDVRIGEAGGREFGEVVGV